MEASILHWIIPILLGIGLSAATGIRIFLPFFLISLSKNLNFIDFGIQFQWLDVNTVLIILGIATLVEILGYYIPLVDHILDLVATPLAFAAGIIGMSSVIPDMPVYIDNILSIIIGGGTAVSFNSIMGFWRVKTTASTAGLANPIYSTVENIMSAVFTFLSFLIPVLFGILILLFVLGSFRFIQKLFQKKRKRNVVKKVLN